MENKQAREIVAALIASTTLTWDESKDVLAILASLHAELYSLLVKSGLYNAADLNKLMLELDAVLLRTSLEMTDFMNKAQSRAWMTGVGLTENTLSAVELKFVKGLTGYENQLVQQFLTVDRISGVTSEMQAQIRSQVLSGVMLEKTPQQVMSYVTNIIGIKDQRGFRQIGTTGISAKAERIVRTELMTINNAGSWYSKVKALEQFPDLEDIWIATGDDRTRKTHLAAHGQRKKVDGLFIVGTEKARFPGDPNLSPKERVNCRCTSLTYRSEWGVDILDEIRQLTGNLPVDVDKIHSRKGSA